MRTVLIAATLSTLATPVTAQLDAPPSGLAEVELRRSRTCVGVLGRVDQVNGRLDPLALRMRRVAALAEAVSLEDNGIVSSLDATDALERQVRDWFTSDATLAQRLVAQPDPAMQAARTAGREVIKAAVTTAMEEIQAEANGIIEENRDLLDAAAPCDGAIFVRSEVLAACEDGSALICEQARLPASEVSGFRFVDTPDNIWQIQEFRPWTAPTPLGPGPTGQLDGGRTVGFVRAGNVVVSVAFTPVLRDVEETTPEELATWRATNDSLGITFSHPAIAFVPGLGVRAALPEALGGEDRYMLHFGSPDAPHVLWLGEAGTGAPLQVTNPLSAADVRRLQTGDPVVFTALRTDESGVDQIAWAIALSEVNQAPATQTLLGYMASQLSIDLNTLLTPRG